jgi:hypothetical protein
MQSDYLYLLCFDRPSHLNAGFLRYLASVADTTALRFHGFAAALRAY